MSPAGPENLSGVLQEGDGLGSIGCVFFFFFPGVIFYDVSAPLD